MSGGSHGDGRLRWRCEAAARGEFPEPDWELEIVPAPARVVAAVCGFTGHHLIATDLPEEEVRRQLGADDPAAPMNPTFLGWLGRRLDANVGHVDLVLAGRGTGSGSNWLRPIAEPPDNERVRRAQSQRAGVSYLAPPEGDAIVTIGAGLADRCELSIEIAGESERSQGTGTRLLLAALDHLAADQVAFASVAPGNARSIRCFLAAGFVPVGAESILTTIPA
jgi:hypothetical protein